MQDVDGPDDFVNEDDVDQNEEEDEGSESITRAGDALLQSMKTEVETFLAGGLRRRGRVQPAARCPFCPFRSGRNQEKPVFSLMFASIIPAESNTWPAALSNSR